MSWVHRVLCILPLIAVSKLQYQRSLDEASSAATVPAALHKQTWFHTPLIGVRSRFPSVDTSNVICHISLVLNCLCSLSTKLCFCRSLVVSRIFYWKKHSLTAVLYSPIVVNHTGLDVCECRIAEICLKETPWYLPGRGRYIGWFPGPQQPWGRAASSWVSLRDRLQRQIDKARLLRRHVRATSRGGFRRGCDHDLRVGSGMEVAIVGAGGSADTLVSITCTAWRIKRRSRDKNYLHLFTFTPSSSCAYLFAWVVMGPAIRPSD